MIFLFILTAVLSYIIGSLNYSIIFSKIFMNTDVRSSGSGNAGSTNMMRNYGWKAGVITLLTDFLKTFVVTFGTWILFTIYYPVWVQPAVAVSGLFCVLGHCFPVFFSFKGGKGVAVGAITSLLVDWRCFIVIVASFLIFVAISKHISLGSVIGAIAFPASFAFFNDFHTLQGSISFTVTLIICLLVVFLHRKNIVRIFKGTESKLSFKKI